MLLDRCVLDGPTVDAQLQQLATCVESSDSADPWQFNLGMLMTIGVAVLALIGVGVTVHQRRRADGNDHLWHRMQWALEQAETGNENARTAGFLVMAKLLDPSEAKAAGYKLSGVDKDLLRVVSQQGLPARPARQEEAK
ncbi:hypothetical protein [Plantibacter sp. YIM 135249]|uniref:hypothetical protein n=1 Tax=Plantibacter sp. YIM 135249 TaxID=3423918 RepID=UPI003D3482C2